MSETNKPAILMGFTPIPNDLIRRGLMRVDMTARESRIFWSLISFSWSWHRPYCYLSYRELSSVAAISLTHTHDTVQSLISKNILQTEKTKTKTKFVLNRDVASWAVVFKKNKIQKAIEASDFYQN